MQPGLYNPGCNFQAEAPENPALGAFYAQLRSCLMNGVVRMRLPVA
jgi:hypothetical protein